jgi:hypothetical protein
MDPQPHRHLVARRQRRVGQKRSEGVQQVQPRPDRPLRVVFMRYGVAKIDQHAIAQVLGQITIEALHHVGTGLVIGADNLPVVFRVQVPRQHGRVHQITEQHGEMAAFRLRRC